MSPLVYCLYGIALISELPFSYLRHEARKKRRIDKRILFQNGNFHPPNYSKAVSLSGGIRYQTAGNPRFISISSSIAGEFHIDLLKKSIRWKPASTRMPPGLAQTFVTGRILGFLLPFFEPTLVLHGCALVVDGGVAGLLGPRGAGKSTLATSFLRRGFPLLSDDLVVIQKREGKWVVQPGPPEIRLWPDTAKMLVKQGVKTEVLYPETKKKRILLNGKRPFRFWDRPVPLKALFILSRRRRGWVRLKPLKGKKAFLGILRARYNQIPEKPEILKDQFRIAAELIGKVSTNQIVYPSGFHRLEKISETILKTVSP